MTPDQIPRPDPQGGPDDPDALAVAVRIGILTLTLTTAAIHYSLGGTLFLLNALGYLTLLGALTAPLPALASLRWLVRLALAGFAAATIGGWFLFGARYDVAYFTKAVEVALIVLLGIELYRFDGGPTGIARRARSVVVALTGAVTGR